MILNPFKGKNILITGGSRGIGLEMAREFAANGANLALIARGKDDLLAAKTALEALGQGIVVRAYACDVTNAETLADYINMIQFELGPLDGVVANSGYCHPGNFHELNLQDFDRQIDTNLRGAIYTVRLALPHLLQNPKGGFVAITSSPAGHMGIFGFSAYGPTKAALSNLAETLHAEYGDRGIRVHLLLPPDTDTPGYREEIKLYPPECRAVLAGGSLLTAEYVAKKLVTGIANNKRRIAVGWEARAMMTVLRLFPGVWDVYTASKKKSARKV
jgi:3-dehydrosphinganine reductase